MSSFGVGAYFADVAGSSGNAIDGASLDAKLSEAAGTGVMHDEAGVDETHDTWEDTAHATDGSEMVSNTVTIDGTAANVDAARTSVVVSFAENDTGSLATAGNAKVTAETIRVTELAFGGRDLLAATVADENGNGRIDVADLTLGDTAANLTALVGVTAGGSIDLHLTISGKAKLLPPVTSGDGLDIRIRVETRVGSLVDVDHVRNNTIQYA